MVACSLMFFQYLILLVIFVSLNHRLGKLEPLICMSSPLFEQRSVTPVICCGFDILFFLCNIVPGNQSSIPQNRDASDEADAGETIKFLLVFLFSNYFLCMFNFSLSFYLYAFQCLNIVRHELVMNDLLTCQVETFLSAGFKVPLFGLNWVCWKNL